MRRSVLATGVVVLLAALAAPRAASAQQSVNFWIGAFIPRDGRPFDDVLLNNTSFLSFRVRDFSNGTGGGEWAVDLGRHVDAGLGIGYYQGSVPSVYTGYVNSDGTELRQEMRLRTVPFTAIIRVTPAVHGAPIEPYFGVGVGVLGWKYTEAGQFVDFSDLSINSGSFSGSGTAVGPVVVGGVRVPVGVGALGGEIRYQNAEGKLPPGGGFSAPKIDLSGFNYLITYRLRF